MDGISVAASLIGIAEAGFQIATKLIMLATQIRTASDRVSSIGNDISLTSGVLRQLGELMNQNQKTTDDGISIFKEDGLELTRKSAATCERIFLEVKNEAMKASKQIREPKRLSLGKIKLSNAEKAKWPFLQPSIEILRGDLREAKGTLMLMLQLVSLALCKKMADVNQEASLDRTEQRDFMLAIKALLQEQKDAKGVEHHDPTEKIPRETSGQEISNTATKSLHLDRVQSREMAVRPDLPHPKLKIEVHLFLLKPMVKNFFDKVELRWYLQNTQMRESAIYRYMAQQEDETSVVNMLHTLDNHEKRILDGVIFGIDMSTEGSLLSLKRTKKTICHRDITFTDVPGLQFVVRRERRIPEEVTINRERRIPEEVTISVPEPIVSPGEMALPRPWRYGLAGGGIPSYPIREERERERQSMYPVAIGAQIGAPPIGSAIVSSDSEDEGFEAHEGPMSLPEQDEDAVIDDMLKKYTTLFD